MDRERFPSFAQEILMKKYESSRLSQPTIDRAHRYLDASNKRDDLKRYMKIDCENFGDNAELDGNFSLIIRLTNAVEILSNDDFFNITAPKKMKTQQLPQKPFDMSTFPSMPTKENRSSLQNSMFPPFSISRFFSPHPKFNLNQRIPNTDFVRPFQDQPKPTVPSMPNLIDAIAASMNISLPTSSWSVNSANDLSIKNSDKTPSSKISHGFLSVEKLLGNTNQSRDNQNSPSSTSSTSSTTISPDIPSAFNPFPVTTVASTPMDATSDFFKKLFAATRTLVSSQSVQQSTTLPKTLSNNFIPPPPLPWLRFLNNPSEVFPAQENGIPLLTRDASSSST